MFKFNKSGGAGRSEECTGHDTFVRPPIPDKWVKYRILIPFRDAPVNAPLQTRLLFYYYYYSRQF